MFEISNKIYTQVKEKFPSIYTFKAGDLEIPFDSSWTNIGINLSGGADSASLCLLVANHIKANNLPCKIHVINFVRCWKTRPWQGPIALEVYNELKRIFPEIMGERFENYIPPELEWGVSGPIINGRSGVQIEGSSFNEYISYKMKLDAVFNATSKNPSEIEFHNRLSARDKNPEDATVVDMVYKSNNTFFCHPYRFVEKDWIIAQYFVHGHGKLFKMTRSCEGDLAGDDIVKALFPTLESYTPGKTVPECSTCFWCLERNWALTRFSRYVTVND